MTVRRKLRVFVSSVQSEFASVRREVKAFLLGDALLRRFVDNVFLFEDGPAKDDRPGTVYLGEVNRCDVYLGIFGKDYGTADAEGLSPTEREFDEATRLGKTRFVYVWGSNDAKRSPEMQALIKRANTDVVRRRVEDFVSLRSAVYASFVDLLDETGRLTTLPFDESPCEQANLRSLDRKRLDWFLGEAHRERQFPYEPGADTRTVLTHLDLIEGKSPKNAAVVLFGADPQRFFTTAHVKCMQCAGSQYQRPFLAQQTYGGNAFQQIDDARAFVLSRLNVSIGVRATSAQAPTRGELPDEAVTEAIINAVAHRDYSSKGSVEVRLLSDRLEVWNPGALPAGLTPAMLAQDHASLPYNPLLAGSLYLARYIERAGSGAQRIVQTCKEVGLPAPTFEQRGGSFVVTLWRDRLTTEAVDRLGLNDRQRTALGMLRDPTGVSRGEYAAAVGCSARTAARDLAELVQLGVLELRGRGPAARYFLAGKSLS
ncbi:MAG: ATP-binding protein [Lacipirellulaceae bacterium]